MTTMTIDWSYYLGDVPGYGACRAVPGEYACLLPDRYVESSFAGFTGQATLPPGNENINYIRIPHKPGDGRIAGGGQIVKPDPVYEWQWPAGWVRVGTMWGPNAVVYGFNDVLCVAPTRSQYLLTSGWYYGYGGLVAASANRANVERDLYEFTDFGDVGIGQSAAGNAVVSFLLPKGGGYEPLRKLPLPAGCDARFMLTDRTGDQFGIAAVDLAHRHTYFFWPTLAELYALPFLG
jgi:hypothetical protein